MKISFITTCLNEQENITDFLICLEKQSLKPTEVIIVDAGSQDATVKLIKKYRCQSKLTIHLIEEPGLNRSQARNLAINRARYQIIAVSDLGCLLDQDWLKLITTPFQAKKTKVVAGYYRADPKNIFQSCQVPFVAIPADKLNLNTFLPSSRSLAFRRSAWLRVGGYPQHLNYCEDLIFATNLKQKLGLKVQPQALVYWHMSASLSAFFRRIKNYTCGDVQAHYQPHLQKIISLYLRYLIFIVFPPLFLVYLIFTIFKFYRYINHPLALVYLPLLRLTLDLAMIFGSLQGKINPCP